MKAVVASREEIQRGVCRRAIIERDTGGKDGAWYHVTVRGSGDAWCYPAVRELDDAYAQVDEYMKAIF